MSAVCSMVTMRLGSEVMAIPADCLREILEPVPVTRVPTADRFSAGMVNVRGSVVPLADLKIAFGLEETEQTEDTRFLVLDVRVEGEVITVGIIADKVHDVVEIDPATLEDIPGAGMKWPPEFISGIGKWQGEFVLLPDLEKVFSQAIARGASAGPVEEGK